jgi:hypothetical protein
MPSKRVGVVRRLGDNIKRLVHGDLTAAGREPSVDRTPAPPVIWLRLPDRDLADS